MIPAEWTSRRFVALDTETTGADPRTARIVTAAVVMVGGGEPPVSLTWLIAPDVPIEEGAAQVHGVSNAHAHKHGMPPGEAIAEIASVLREQRPAGSPLVVYNARYDVSVMHRECDRNRVERIDPRPVVDPMVIDRFLDRYRGGSRKLADVAAHYRTPALENAHAADADALTAARIAWRIGTTATPVRRRGELARVRAEWERVRDDLDLLHDAQVEWAAEQARGLQDYFRKQPGREHEVVEGDWPVLPENGEQ